jgi:hypothetical protein
MAVEKWTAGAQYPWAAAFGNSTTTGISALANGSAMLSTISIANGSSLVNGDIFADISILSTFAMAIASPLYLGIYIMPLNEDGTTYGDGYVTSTVAKTFAPGANYLSGVIQLPSTVGSTALNVVGSVSRLILPQGTFSFAAYNQLGVALSTVFNIQYRTYNRSVA